MIQHTIPVTVLDNFFVNPKWVRELALQQEFHKDENGRWPGKRTKPIHEIYPGLHDYICRRFLSLFFTEDKDIDFFQIAAIFQLVDVKYKNGWVHRDPSLVSGIVFLNDDETMHDSGTTIYEPLYEGLRGGLKQKTDFYRGEIPTDEPFKTQHNSCYKESIIVKNKFNRLIAFDGQLNHAANDFIGTDNNNSRLTMAFFINHLDVQKTPVRRCEAGF
jgi:hypothetical protein